MAITWTDDNTSINTCQAKGDWTGTGFANPDDNTSGSGTPVYREGTGCMAAVAASSTSGSWSDTIAVNLTDVALVWWIWLSGPTEIGGFSFFQVEVEDGAAFVNYDFLPEITTRDIGGWFPAVLWPTDDGSTFITSSGSIVIAGIDTLTIRANNTGGTDIKLVGWDYIHSIGLIGAAADTVTLEDFVTRDAANNFGVVTQVGTTFQAQCNLRYGGTGTTTVSESNKTLTFRGANSDHPVGFIFNSGGTATNITWSDMVFNWTFPQPAFTLTADPNTFKFDGCQFNGAGTIPSPAHSTLRWYKTCKFNDCGEIDIDDLTFEDNTIANATSGVLYSGTGTRRSVNNTYLNNTDALHFDTAQTITLDGDTFSGNTTDIHFSGTGTLTINPTNGANPVTSRVTGGGTVVINQPAVTILDNVKDSSGNNLQNARVFIETAATIALGEIYQAAVTSITQAAGTATVTMAAVHGLTTGDKIVVRKAQPDGYNKVATATVTSTTVFTYPVDSGLSSPATGTPVVSFVAIHGLTDASGNISLSKAWGAAQEMKGWARLKNTSSPFYKDADIAFTVNTSAGNTINSVLQPDE